MVALKAVNCTKLNLYMTAMSDPIPNEKNFLLYTAADGIVRIEVFLEDETVWLTQKQYVNCLE